MSHTMQDRIRERLKTLDLSEEKASKEAGFSRDYLRKLLARPSGAPQAGNLEKLAKALRTTPTWLITGEGEHLESPDQSAGFSEQLPTFAPHSPLPPSTGPVPDILRGDVRPANVTLPLLRNLPSDVPVYGTAAGSAIKGAFQFEGGIVEFVRRPPALAGSNAVYALYIEGTSMEPEHNAGELRFVHTARPVKVGDSVIVQVRTHPDVTEAYIARYLKQTPTQLVLKKLNPDMTIELKRDYVVAMHKVLTVNELFGV